MGLVVLDRGRGSKFGFDDLMRYHGPGSPGGVAHAYKVLELALPLLGDPPERREIEVATAFGGPGARDGFELVLRAVTEGRYTVDPGLARPERGWTRERFVFRLACRARASTLGVREGFVTEEFLDAGALRRTPARGSDVLKREMAERVMAADAAAVYERLELTRRDDQAAERRQPHLDRRARRDVERGDDRAADHHVAALELGAGGLERLRRRASTSPSSRRSPR